MRRHDSDGRGVLGLAAGAGEIAPVTGDWVEIGDTEGLGTVIARVLPRRTAVSRRDPAEKDLEQILASNVALWRFSGSTDRCRPAGSSDSS